MIFLREVRDEDLPAFWRHVSDPAARHVAAVTRQYHYDRGHFDAHWARIRSNPEVLMRTVVADDEVVGHAAVYGPPDEREVTYWIDRAHWGRGIATAALVALIDLDGTRPLHAHVVADNVGSIRVLEKCGFVITEHGRGFAQERGGEIDEVLLTLK
ncbi:GNAT family N-acetyltransferase [Streptomyces agglomeratus]|uniref:GNAT family N-acetyltransferase n=1 Tax=Streptomyces agglomeratus TaxID=285458 RepID=A0A1E5PI60_9ACTN|nr:GNAT family N-acetyltransferase [Streptomyces agglomeratus]OEJ29202.1 GNAT family N-acetyltransferase [Streptomyces agglomeratus]OEJ48689.1 GNAT family N-acetyltransferase [Streptomyces agglomeratus]OEJ56106.1 GNAT family N-acetyltransferase [Streptomyces agglomeratus]